MNTRLKYVDALRGMAIIGVVSIHSIYNADAIVKLHGGTNNSVLTAALNQGKYGVELFFFISGWLLNSLYNNSQNRQLKIYWVRRLARIYPLWLLFIIISTIRLHSTEIFRLDIPEIQGLNSFQFISIIFLNLTFLTFISATSWNTLVPGGWSIQSEIIHYFIFWRLIKIKWESLIQIYILIGISTFFAQFIKKDSVNYVLYDLIQSWLRLNLFSTMVYFVIGIGYSKLLSGEVKLDIPNILKPLNLIALTVFLILPLNFGHNSVAAVFIILCILVVRKSPEILLKFLEKIGKYSYFIYFFHFILVTVLFNFFSTKSNLPTNEPSQILMFVFFFSISLGLSFYVGAFSFKFVENPIMLLARRYTQR